LALEVGINGAIHLPHPHDTKRCDDFIWAESRASGYRQL
jgi:hypothetical protein